MVRFCAGTLPADGAQTCFQSPERNMPLAKLAIKNNKTILRVTFLPSTGKFFPYKLTATNLNDTPSHIYINVVTIHS